jgi:hypothetical protein
VPILLKAAGADRKRLSESCWYPMLMAFQEPVETLQRDLRDPLRGVLAAVINSFVAALAAF